MALFRKIKYTTLTRRGCDITLPTDVYTTLQKKGYNVILTNAKSVQLVKDKKYIGTLKSFMKVSGFKNGNTCDFHKSNVIK